MLKKFLILVFIISICCGKSYNVKAYSEVVEDVYTVTKEDGTFLFERIGVEIGDIYLNSDFEEYIVISIDNVFKTGIARFNRQIQPPKVNFNYMPSPIDTSNKVICMYSTHNDESYITGDGVDSVYGKGGIHDVAKLLKREFMSLGVNTVYNETLHIPHDNSAYLRSKITAKSMINEYKPNAIFDIHRDGASRSTYVSKYNGVDVCKIRMVVGKGNRNSDINNEFALYLMSVAKEIYPWLFLDIYFGNGHYNQELSNKAILFEMGSHLVEKELVIKSVKPLAEVVNIALFGTTINDKGEAIIGGNTSVNPTIDQYFDNENLAITKSNNSNTLAIIFIITAILIVLLGGAFVLIKVYNKNKNIIG